MAYEAVHGQPEVPVLLVPEFLGLDGGVYDRGIPAKVPFKTSPCIVGVRGELLHMFYVFAVEVPVVMHPDVERGPLPPCHVPLPGELVKVPDLPNGRVHVPQIGPVVDSP